MYRRTTGSSTTTTTAIATMPYPAPPSPTLTNPDMILPWSEYDANTSPPQRLPQSKAHTNNSNSTWTGNGLDFQLGAPGYIGLAIGPTTPTTPIIYGNGTMLSDIGEVTEAESTPAKKVKLPATKHQRIQIQTSSDSLPIQSSPTVGYDAVMKKTKYGGHQRQVSLESTSTIRTVEEQAIATQFDDFDDGVSVDESGFGGDDEESIADDSYEHQVAYAQAALVARKDSVKKIMTEDSSSAALSRRAELILANAKKRLDNMEGNLTRARSSLYITPSSSMSSIHSSSPLSRSTPSPPTSNQRTYSQSGMPLTRHRSLNQAHPSPVSSGHNRISSETAIHSAPHPRLPLTVRLPINPGRSFERLPDSRNDDPKSSSDQESVISARPYKGSPLGSGSVTPREATSEEDGEHVQGRFHGERSATAEPFLYPRIEHRVLARSSSSMQMRDLTDKMKDLKGKIGQLRERAKEDNMKRRSLQSLRTPSPFTAAESWYASSSAYEKGTSADAGVSRSPWNGEPSLLEEEEEEEEEEAYAGGAASVQDGSSDFMSAHEDMQQSEASEISSELTEEQNQVPTDLDDSREEDEEYQEDVVEGEYDEYRSESVASLYHDTLTTPVSHEDREDAFDYEHFFLHSAMGTISQQRMNRRGSTGSYESDDSDDSVATARGISPVRATAQKDLRTARGHLKNQKSADSVSTMATFATATEGFSPEEDTILEAEDSDFEENVYDHVDEHGAVTSQTPDSSGVEPGNPQTKSDERNWTPEAEPPPVAPNYSRPSSAPHHGSFHRQGVKSRPSVSSFASSTGTTRSFPLVNRPKTSLGPTPPSSNTDGTPPTTSAGSSNREKDREKAPSVLSNETSESTANENNNLSASVVAGLEKSDQYLVERLVASLGKCVLGVQEDGRGSVEGRMWRRRLELARRVLEGEVTM